MLFFAPSKRVRGWGVALTHLRNVRLERDVCGGEGGGWGRGGAQNTPYFFLNNCSSADTLCAFDKLLIGQEGHPMLVGDAEVVPHVGNVLFSCPINKWEYSTHPHHSVSSECTKYGTFFSEQLLE